MPDRPKENVANIKEQAATLAQAIIEQAANRAMDGAGKAREVATGAKGRVRRAPQVTEEVVPSVRDVALQAAAAALDLWQAARERAEGLSESAGQAFGEPASNVVGQAEKRAREAASIVADRADEVTGRAKAVTRSVAGRAEGMTERAKGRGKDVAQRADEVTDRAKDASRHAAEATVETSKDTGAALLWTAAAAGIVFYALLDKDRREQVLQTLDSVVHQIREIIRDFQGYDEEFV
jgi:hypothetical protein